MSGPGWITSLSLQFLSLTEYALSARANTHSARGCCHAPINLATTGVPIERRSGVPFECRLTGLQGAYLDADGQMTNVGGKTGTGDNRFDTFARGGGLISTRPVDRTATFAFFLSDRFYGTITAYVAGRQAGQYSFTSALAVQVLKVLEPALRPLVGLPEAQEPRPLGLKIDAENRSAP